MGRPAINLEGQVFGRLTVVSRAGRRGNDATWNCACSCGGSTEAAASHLRRGAVTSCGCWVADRLTTHGLTGTRIYTIWRNMHWRCCNPSHKDYSSYGGRGISICDRWHKLENFLADMGEPPAGHSIERKDVNGNYTPENCVWAPPEVQQNNRRNNVRLTADGKTLSLAQWERETGTSQHCIRKRLARGWSHREAIFGKTIGVVDGSVQHIQQ